MPCRICVPVWLLLLTSISSAQTGPPSDAAIEADETTAIAVSQVRQSSAYTKNKKKAYKTLGVGSRSTIGTDSSSFIPKIAALSALCSGVDALLDRVPDLATSR